MNFFDKCKEEYNKRKEKERIEIEKIINNEMKKKEQYNKENLRYSDGVEFSDLLTPTKHVETRNNELLRALTTQNHIIIKQNDEIISILKDISKKLDK